MCPSVSSRNREQRMANSGEKVWPMLRMRGENPVKKEYIKPEIEEIRLEAVDIITTSFSPGEDETPLVPVFH